ncbi:MAG: T9SS type A sorting domain-containing protein [Bacteroidia bacterium]
MKKKLLFIAFGFFSFYVSAKEDIDKSKSKQQPQTFATGCFAGTAQMDLDLSNVRARILQAGDMWWDLNNSKYEVPKDSGKHSMFAGALWIGGIDAGGQIKLAAHTYRQTGNDWYPGPMDTVLVDASQAQCLAYDRFWKLTRQEVQTFAGGGAATPNIVQWPGNGNSFNNEGHFLAPFYDANGNGIYEYTAGDYPYYDLSGASSGGNCNSVLHGDQTIWWAFNDVGNVHTETNGTPIGLEVQAQAFVFASQNVNVNNSTFYQYKIINRSTFTLNQCYFGNWADPDLGYALDDFIGCDVNRGMGYCYNADPDDNASQGGYGLNPPAIGIDFLQGPLADPGDGIDNDRDGTIDEPGEQIIMSKFVYYNNDFSATGNPIGFYDFYGYLKGIWRDSIPMTYGGDGYDPLSTNYCDFMFPDNTDTVYYPTLGAWTEVTAGNVAGDRRFLQTAGAFTLLPGAVNYITVGVIWARTTAGGPYASVDSLKNADDLIQQIYDSCFFTTSVSELAAAEIHVTVSPNPFFSETIIHFNNPQQDKFSFIVYDVKGKEVRKISGIKSTEVILKKENLNSGVYFYKLQNSEGKSFSGKLVVQ